MRLILQRVKSGRVLVSERTVAEIGRGLGWWCPRELRDRDEGHRVLHRSTVRGIEELELHRYRVTEVGRQAGTARATGLGPQRLPDWNPNAGGIRAFYFRDPDEHFLEILQFPPGRGAGRWHAAGGPLFLGIDHTAIVVRDTDVSLRFYRDELGMKVAGESENYGVEQEHLNNVSGAHLRITSLRAASGPGIELLEYALRHDDGPPTDRMNRFRGAMNYHLAEIEAFYADAFCRSVDNLRRDLQRRLKPSAP